MKKKNKDHKLASFTSGQENETNDPSELGREDERSQNQVGVEVNGKKPRVGLGSPSNDNVSPKGHPNPPNLQWCSTPRAANDQHQPQLVAAASVNLPGAGPCRPQAPLNTGFHQLQHFQLPPHFVAPNAPAIWPPPRPGFQPIAQIGTTDNSWQASMGSGLVTASGSLSQLPTVCYQLGSPYPVYSAGPWDPSSWCGQVQQAPPPYLYPFPGACNFFPTAVQQPTTNCSAASLHLPQKGIIRPSAEMSQKHQLLWESQSAENVQLWAVINGLQSELADFRSRLAKLETDAKCPQPSAEQFATPDIGSGLVGQATKRGRRRKPVPSVDALPSTLDNPRPRGRRPATYKGPPEIKEINFQKDSINKPENAGMLSPSVIAQHGGGGKFTSSGDPTDVNSALPNIMQIQAAGVGLISTSEKKISYDESKEKRNGVTIKLFPAACVGTKTNNYGLPLSIPSRNGTEVMCGNSQGFHSQGDGSGQGNGGLLPWNMVNEDEIASEDLDEETTESDKQDEEMENVDSMCAEGVHKAKNEDEHCANLQETGDPPGFPSW